MLHIGLIVADMPIKVPYQCIDFTQDSIPIEKFDILPGGDATNAACVMARLGKKAGLCAKIGDDNFGRIVIKTVGECGVDVENIKADTDTKTSMSVVLINDRGERSFLFCSGNNQDFSLNDIDLAKLSKAKHINYGSFFGLPKLDKEGAAKLFQAAHRLGITTSADVTEDCFHVGYSGIREALAHVDFFMPSYGEAKYLSGESEPEKMADFFIRDTGEKTVVVKMGEEGCFIRSGGKSRRVRSYKVIPVDTTGAGDNFVAGFLTGLTNGWDVVQCADYACAVAAFSVQHLGATSDLMNQQAIEDFIRRTPRA